ncbi:hypothetical protein [Luteimonas sp. A501]
MLADLRDVLSRFRTRAPGEVPEEPGVCLPHAFIADEGKGDLILLLLHGHPDKRFNTAIRGETDDQEKAGTKAERKRFSPEFKQQALGMKTPAEAYDLAA